MSSQSRAVLTGRKFDNQYSTRGERSMEGSIAHSTKRGTAPLFGVDWSDGNLDVERQDDVDFLVVAVW